MANLLVPLFSLRRWSFDNLSSSGVINIVVVREIPCAAYRELTLLVRVHSASFASGASIKLAATEVAPTDDQPGSDFPSLSSLCSIGINSSTSPALYDASANGPFGGSVRIELLATRGTSGSCQADLEADIVLKE